MEMMKKRLGENAGKKLVKLFLPAIVVILILSLVTGLVLGDDIIQSSPSEWFNITPSVPRANSL